MNESFEILGVTDPLRTNGNYWIDNILVPIPAWGVGGTVKNLNWGSGPISRYDGVSVLCHGDVPACPVYLPRSPENTRTTACHVRDYLLRDNRMALVQSLSDSRHILRDHLVNRTDCAWGDLWDEPFEY